MAVKVSFKVFIVISLLFGFLFACVDPVSISKFMESGEVEYITKKKVKIDPTSKYEASLREGYERITGLDLNKYYMIESVKDDKDAPVSGYPKFVWENGRLDANLYAITRTSGSINGLTNDYTYKIREAENCSDTSFSYSVNGSGSFPAPVENGKITITPSAATDTFSLINLITAYNGYDVMAVGVSFADLPSTSIFSNSKQTIGGGITEIPLVKGSQLPTVVDYVFAKIDATIDFKVLRVEIKSVPAKPETDMVITISFDGSMGELTTPAGGSADISLTSLLGGNTTNLTVTVIGTPSSIIWYHGDTKLTGTAFENNTITLDKNIPDILIVGTHKFTAVAEVNGKQYSAVFTLNVTAQTP